MQLNKTTSLIITAILGFLYLYVAVVMMWGFIVVNHPFMDWLLENYAGTSWFRSAIFVQDFIINIVFAAPLAFFIYSLHPKSYVSHAAAAILPGFVWAQSNWLLSPDFSQVWQNVFVSWVYNLACLPIALAVVIWIGRKRA